MKSRKANGEYKMRRRKNGKLFRSTIKQYVNRKGWKLGDIVGRAMIYGLVDIPSITEDLVEYEMREGPSKW